MTSRWLVYRMQAQVKLWCDLGTDVWHAHVILTDYRNGQQYGGELVTHLHSKPRQSRSSFLRAVRAKTAELVNTCWT